VDHLALFPLTCHCSRSPGIVLTEVQCRVELREVATEEDAVEVVDLMRQTLLDEFLDGEGVLDFRRAGGKSKQVLWGVMRCPCY